MQIVKCPIRQSADRFSSNTTQPYYLCFTRTKGGRTRIWVQCTSLKSIQLNELQFRNYPMCDKMLYTPWRLERINTTTCMASTPHWQEYKYANTVPLERSWGMPMFVLTRSLFVNLPRELIDRIFWFAAESRQTCLDLCLVSSLAHRIALPHLLHTVVIKNHVVNNRFRRALRSGAFPLAPFVRNVWMEAVSEHVVDLFNTCHNLEHIALVEDVFVWLIRGISTSRATGRWSNKDISSSAVAGNDDLHITFINPHYGWEPRLMISQIGEIHNDVNRFLSAITHITLAGPPSFWAEFEGLICFKRLSHFAFPCSRLTLLRKYLGNLLHIDSLEMIVIVINEDMFHRADMNEWVSYIIDARRSDTRIYLVNAVEGRMAGLRVRRDLWDKEVRSAESIWERAVRYTDKMKTLVRLLPKNRTDRANKDCSMHSARSTHSKCLSFQRRKAEPLSPWFRMELFSFVSFEKYHDVVSFSPQWNV